MSTREDPSTRRANIALLVVAIAGAAFAAYEKAALTFNWFPDTISWYGHNYPVVKLIVFALFVLGGIGGGLWWLWHTAQAIPR